MQKWQGKPLVELLFLLEMLRAQKPEVLRRGISITFLHLFLTTQSHTITTSIYKTLLCSKKKKKKDHKSKTKFCSNALGQTTCTVSLPERAFFSYFSVREQIFFKLSHLRASNEHTVRRQKSPFYFLHFQAVIIFTAVTPNVLLCSLWIHHCVTHVRRE